MKAISYSIEVRDRFSSTMQKFNRQANLMASRVDRVNKRMLNLNSRVDRVNKKMLNFQNILKSRVFRYGLPLAALYTIKSFADFEEAMYKVAKTADIAVGKPLDNMADKFKKLSALMPNTASELALVGASAAQMGVRGGENITNFAETMGMLASATDVYGQEGSAQMARLINVVGGDIGNIDRYASALTHLGNTSAATEREILRFATDMASRSQGFSMSGQDAMGLAAAFKSVGLQSELASGAVSRVLGMMNQAVYVGGDEAIIMSAISGKTIEELRKAFESDAVGALIDLGSAMDRVEKQGVDFTQALNSLGVEGQRDKTVLTTLAKRVDLVKESMAKSQDEFKRNTALIKEYNVQLNTTWNRLKILYGASKLFAISLFDPVSDQFKGLVDTLSEMLTQLSSEMDVTASDKIKRTLIFLYKNVFKGVFEFLRPYVKSVMEDLAEIAMSSFVTGLKNTSIGKALSRGKSQFMNDYTKTDAFIGKGVKTIKKPFNALLNILDSPLLGGIKGISGGQAVNTPMPTTPSVNVNINSVVSADKGSSVVNHDVKTSGNRGRMLETLGVSKSRAY
tara:strand:- start:436 stop:2142 length:1707 start_codon:yes stop_codon:yes gene_type:complete